MLGFLTDYIALSAILPLGLFVYYYGRYSPWRATNIGRIMMYKQISFIAVFVVIGLGLFFGDYPGRDILRFLVYTAVVIMFWVNFVTMRKVQVQHSTQQFPRFIDRFHRKNWRKK